MNVPLLGGALAPIVTILACLVAAVVMVCSRRL